MRFPDEVVAPDELGEDVVPQNGRKLDKREVDMAKQLIDSLTSDFDPGKYRDEYREELLALIDRKAKGEAVVEPVSEEPKPTKAPDLMAALEESLAAVRGEPLATGGDGGKKTRKRSTSSKSGSRSKTSQSKSRSRSKAKAAK
jgi:DNA end-binding protein Ku